MYLSSGHTFADVIDLLFSKNIESLVNAFYRSKVSRKRNQPCKPLNLNAQNAKHIASTYLFSIGL